MSKKSNLNFQFNKELKKETKFGQSKDEAKKIARQEAKLNNEDYKQIIGIYSSGTLYTYSSDIKTFVNYIIEHHTEVKSMDDAFRYIPEYIKDCRDRGLSEWTIHKYSYALRSAYHSTIKDMGITLGERARADIKRDRAAEFNEKRHNPRYNETVTMAKATGCRHAEILRLRKEDFRWQKDSSGNKTGNIEVYKRGKGGVKRWCLVDPQYNQWLLSFLKETKTYNVANEERIFRKADAPKDLPLHDCRADYAKNLYNYFDEHGFANGKIYHCRKELAGISYDKGLLELVSYNLQHSRNNVVVNYLWK